MEKHKQQFQYLFEQLDGFHANHTENDEWQLATAISEGNLEKVSELLAGGEDIEYEIIDANQFKTYEYMAVSAVAVVTRIAMISGLPGTEAYRISDVALQRIAACKTVAELQKEQRDAIMEFTEEIQLLSKSTVRNSLVEQAKTYIADHIYEPISLSDLSSNLHVSPSYLGRLFVKYEGVSVGDYILYRKVSAAKESLVYTDKSIFEIADYFGYSSQSYFSKQFKAVTGMTPKEYRNAFARNTSL